MSKKDKKKNKKKNKRVAKTITNNLSSFYKEDSKDLLDMNFSIKDNATNVPLSENKEITLHDLFSIKDLTPEEEKSLGEMKKLINKFDSIRKKAASTPPVSTVASVSKTLNESKTKKEPVMVLSEVKTLRRNLIELFAIMLTVTLVTIGTTIFQYTMWELMLSIIMLILTATYAHEVDVLDARVKELEN